MKLKTKKILSILLTLFLMLALTPVGVAPVWAAGEVCEINGTPYATLDAALAAVTNGQTIKLLNYISQNSGITIDGKSFVFDLNGYDLTITESSGIGILVKNSGNVGLTGSGSFNVSGTVCGVKAIDSTVTVTNATASGAGGIGAYAVWGGKITVTGNATGFWKGACAEGTGSGVSVTGDTMANYPGGRGAEALSGGSITVGGNAQGGYAGVNLEGSTSIITVSGSATGTDDNSYGAYAYQGKIVIGGNAKATGGGVTSLGARASNGGNITIGGNAQGGHVGVYAHEANSNIVVKTNVIATAADGIGALAQLGGKITIDGTITAALYIEVNTVKDGTPGSRTSPTTKIGYYTYSDGVNTVWVKDPNTYVAEIGGTQYATLDAALAAVTDGQTIKLLADITDSDGIVISSGKSFTIDLAGHTLNVTNSGDSAKGLEVTNSSAVGLDDSATGGAFTVSGSAYGVYANGATVTVSEATAIGGTAVVALNSADITVNGNAEGTNGGVYASNTSVVAVNGDVVSTDSGTVAVNSQSSTVHVSGSVKAIGGGSSHGVLGSGNITVDGDVEGNQIGVEVGGFPSVITVGGNVRARGTDDEGTGFYCYGALTTGGDINIAGNITAAGGTGARSTGGGDMTIDGTITAAHYIEFAFGFDRIIKNIDDRESSTTKEGYFTYTNGYGEIWVKAPSAPTGVCEIGGIQYATLENALAEVGAGETGTIKLLADINYDKGISITDSRNITFDLAVYTLTVDNNDITNNGGIGLLVTNGSVHYTGSGEFNVTGVSCGVSANGGSASATVTNATATAEGGNGAVAINGGDIVVNGNARGGYNGVSVANTGSTAVVNGNATGTASDSSGARAGSGGSVTINGGTAQGVMYGAYANGSDSHITINGGDAIGTGPYSFGVHAEIDGTINVTGNTQGTQYGVYSSDGTSVVVTGNATVTAAVNGWGVDAESGGTILIGGNVATNGSSLGAFATSGGKITIDGAILASNYIRIFDNVAQAPVYKDGSAGSRTIPTTKTGYFTYSAGTSTIWVKETATDSSLPTWPGGSTLTSSNVGQTRLTLTWPAATDNIGVTGYRILKDGSPYTTVGNVLTSTVTGLAAGTRYTFKVEACDAAGNWSTTGLSVIVTTAAAPTSSPVPVSSGTTPSPVAQVLDSGENITKTISVSTNSITGTISVDVDSASLTAAFDQSKEDDKGIKTVEIDIPKIDGVNAYESVLPVSFLNAGDTSKAVEIKTGIASVTVPGNMIAANVAGAQNISLTIAAADKSKLAAEVQAQIGSRTVIELNLKIDGKQTSWSNESAPVTVTIPYTPTAEELKDPEHITVWYIDGSGKAVAVPSGRYDPETGTVTFTTTHFSYYAVTYVHKTFSDLGSVEWARKPIEVMASKGIINGTGANTYSPAANISRADYLVLLIKTLGLTAEFDGNFDDVQQGAYYYEAIGIAKKLGIATGSGNNRFNPKEYISRQDMMVLAARALEKFKGLKATSDTFVLDKFSDKGDIAGYAADSLATLVKQGLISGSEDKLNPRAQTTRAEAAVFLYRIYNKY